MEFVERGGGSSSSSSKVPSVGLVNPRFFCFYNSTLQVLYHTPAFRNYILKNEKQKEIQDGLKDGVDYKKDKDKQVRVQEDLKQIFSAMITCSKGAMKPSDMLLQKLFQGRNHYKLMQDAHEFFIRLMAKAHEEVSPRADKRHEVLRHSVGIYTVYGGYLRQSVVCQKCSKASTRLDPVVDISLSFPPAELCGGQQQNMFGRGGRRGHQQRNQQQNNTCVPVQNLLKHYFRQETLQGANKYMCSHCKTKQVAVKFQKIHKLPQQMVLHLKQYDDCGRKANRRINLSETLDMAPFCTKGAFKNPEYELYATIHHSGSTVRDGHYYSFCKDASGRWLGYDDSRVHKSSYDAAVQYNIRSGHVTGPYMAFYRLRGNVDDGKSALFEECGIAKRPRSKSADPRLQKTPEEIRFAKEQRAKEFKAFMEAAKSSEQKPSAESMYPPIESNEENPSVESRPSVESNEKVLSKKERKGLLRQRRREEQAEENKRSASVPVQKKTSLNDEILSDSAKENVAIKDTSTCDVSKPEIKDVSMKDRKQPEVDRSKLTKKERKALKKASKLARMVDELNEEKAKKLEAKTAKLEGAKTEIVKPKIEVVNTESPKASKAAEMTKSESPRPEAKESDSSKTTQSESRNEEVKKSELKVEIVTPESSKGEAEEQALGLKLEVVKPETMQLPGVKKNVEMSINFKKNEQLSPSTTSTCEGSPSTDVETSFSSKPSQESSQSSPTEGGGKFPSEGDRESPSGSEWKARKSSPSLSKATTDNVIQTSAIREAPLASERRPFESLPNHEKKSPKSAKTSESPARTVPELSNSTSNLMKSSKPSESIDSIFGIFGKKTLSSEKNGQEVERNVVSSKKKKKRKERPLEVNPELKKRRMEEDTKTEVVKPSIETTEKSNPKEETDGKSSDTGKTPLKSKSTEKVKSRDNIEKNEKSKDSTNHEKSDGKKLRNSDVTFRKRKSEALSTQYGVSKVDSWSDDEADNEDEITSKKKNAVPLQVVIAAQKQLQGTKLERDAHDIEYDKGKLKHKTRWKIEQKGFQNYFNEVAKKRFEKENGLKSARNIEASTKKKKVRKNGGKDNWSWKK